MRKRVNKMSIDRVRGSKRGRLINWKNLSRNVKVAILEWLWLRNGKTREGQKYVDITQGCLVSKLVC